jgi:hypothetical protein
MTKGGTTGIFLKIQDGVKWYFYFLKAKVHQQPFKIC